MHIVIEKEIRDLMNKYGVNTADVSRACGKKPYWLKNQLRKGFVSFETETECKFFELTLYSLCKKAKDEYNELANTYREMFNADEHLISLIKCMFTKEEMIELLVNRAMESWKYKARA